jgi:dihydrofolate reductase
MLSLIAAVAKNNCIGENNKLPWNIPEDLKHFQEITKGKAVLMGRKTFESIMGYLKKPLPNRTNIVITRNTDFATPVGVEIFKDIDSALEAHNQEEIFVIGGSSIYQQTINSADKLYVTLIDQEVDGDAFFPKINPTIWQEIKRENHEGFAFITYVRK